jgi:hypothetical protein
MQDSPANAALTSATSTTKMAKVERDDGVPEFNMIAGGRAPTLVPEAP